MICVVYNTFCCSAICLPFGKFFLFLHTFSYILPVRATFLYILYIPPGGRGGNDKRGTPFYRNDIDYGCINTTGGGVYVYCSGFFRHVFKICICIVQISVYVSALVPLLLCLGVPPLWVKVGQ